MHTQTNTKTGSHRWLVAAPFFVLFLALSIREGIMHRVPAELAVAHQAVVSADKSAKTVAAAASVLRLDVGSKVDVSDATQPILLNGTVLVASRTLSHMSAGTLSMEGWNGGFLVTKQGEDVTIAALTTPVFVREGEYETIIPAFMQWKHRPLSSVDGGMQTWYGSRSPLALPPTFTQNQLEIMQALRSSLTVAAPLMETSLLLPPTFGQALRLESARDRAESAERRIRIDALAQALAHEPAYVDGLLQAADINDLLSSEEGQDAMPILISLALEQGKSDFFLSSFVFASDRLLLASFHPLLRDHTRVLPVIASLSDDEQLSLLMLTPASDATPDALSDIAVTQWQASWQTFLQTQSGAVRIFSDSLAILKDQIDRLDRLQYAKRVDTYASALLSLSEPLQDGFTPAATDALSSIRTLRDARRASADLPEPRVTAQLLSAPAHKEEPVVPTIPPEELILQARDVLSGHGFMLTTQTSFVPGEGGVQVQGIIFGTMRGDLTLRFSFDPVSGQVSKIEQSGKILPYAISLQQFVEWLRG